MQKTKKKKSKVWTNNFDEVCDNSVVVPVKMSKV